MTMIQIPFNREIFSEEAKSRLSGINVNLEYDNLESALFQAGLRMAETIGEATYQTILTSYRAMMESYPLREDTSGPETEAVDYLQRIILHQAIYSNLIFLIVRIGNDGITTKKNNDETTIFKYQQDELANTLINTAWFWTGKLIELLNANAQAFPDWAESAQKQEMDTLPVGISDFRRWAGIDNLYFLMRTRWIIREVWMDRIEARIKTPVPENLKDKISRAVVYSVMQLACERLAYSDLPEAIRKDIDNEQSKANKDKAENRIRELVSMQFAGQAKRYWEDIDREIQAGRKQAAGKFHSSASPVAPDDKFGMIL